MANYPKRPVNSEQDYHPQQTIVFDTVHVFGQFFSKDDLKLFKRSALMD